MIKRPFILLALAVAVAAAPLAAQNPTPAAAAPAAGGVAAIKGVVLDSLHESPLRGALVRIDNSTHEAITDSLGRYRIDSVPTGMHRLVVVHPVLDTIGISLVTPPLTLAAGESREIDLAVPSGETLVTLLCPAARRALGPAALVGFVRDADTEAAAKGAKVSLLYYESDPLGLKKTPRVREYPIGADGRYRICGLPPSMSGKLQVFRNGVQTGEVPVALGDSSDFKGLLAMRAMSISSAATVVATASTDTAGKATKMVRGRSRV